MNDRRIEEKGLEIIKQAILILLHALHLLYIILEAYLPSRNKRATAPAAPSWHATNSGVMISSEGDSFVAGVSAVAGCDEVAAEGALLLPLDSAPFS